MGEGLKMDTEPFSSASPPPALNPYYNFFDAGCFMLWKEERSRMQDCSLLLVALEISAIGA